MPIYDYVCDCGHELKNELAKVDEEILCEECGKPMQRRMSSPHIFTTIIPTYPGSGKHKAGSVHKHVNRPATKTQVGYGGSVSSDHPTGGGKGQG
jgi:putative FmdB family regulatory protein